MIVISEVQEGISYSPYNYDIPRYQIDGSPRLLVDRSTTTCTYGYKNLGWRLYNLTISRMVAKYLQFVTIYH
jgi:hypothetical protein